MGGGGRRGGAVVVRREGDDAASGASVAVVVWKRAAKAEGANGVLVESAGTGGGLGFERREIVGMGDEERC